MTAKALEGEPTARVPGLRDRLWPGGLRRHFWHGRFGWRSWLCPLLAGIIASELGLHVLSWQWLAVLAAFWLGEIDAKVNP